MNRIGNPFLLNDYVSPEYFCDREQETAELLSSMRNGRNVMLRSPRRYGKTGLIKNAFYHIKQNEPDIACFYIDLMPTKSLSDFVTCFGEAIIGKLDTPLQKAQGFVTQFFRNCRIFWSADVLTGEPKIGLDFEPSEQQHTFNQIFEYIRQSNMMCYIAFDEFQQILTYPETNIEALLRSQIQQCPNVRFVFSGSKQHLLSDMFSSPQRPFYRSTEKMSLETLPVDTYYEFSANLLQKKGCSLPKESFQLVYKLSDGVTWYVQYILNRLYEVCSGEITKLDVIDAMEYILKRENDDYQHLLSELTQNQATLLKAIAAEKCIKEPTGKLFLRKYRLQASSSVLRALQYLVNHEIVYKTDGGYVVYDRFLAIWLAKR